ncbi:MAG TPA: hypothetical protein VGK02_09560 [Candidatus Aquicultor sp.]
MTGPRCRNCHKGSSGCGACHNSDPYDPVDGINTSTAGIAEDNSHAAITYLFASMFTMVGMPSPTPDMVAPITAYDPAKTSMGDANPVESVPALDANHQPIIGQVKKSRTVSWSSDWRANTGTVGSGINQTCSDDGLSFPHRTLGWKMLKDDLFGIDPAAADTNGAPGFIHAGQTRTGFYPGNKAHDLDSVCLDCHNPTVWGATSTLNHTDIQGINPMTGADTITADNMNDDLLLRGLP